MSPPSPRRLRIGVLVPSSNTALEPLTTSLLTSLPPAYHATAHFSRFPVTTIGLSASALSQFNPEAILPAAQLLADAHVDVICWSGTSSGWLGFDADDELCRAIESATGIRATTSIIGLNRALRVLGTRRLGLVTPYVDEVQEAIVRNYRGIGVDLSVERHLGRTDNVNFADLETEVLDRMVREVVGEGARVVSTFCTNLSAAGEVERWEGEFGVVVLDTVTTVLWDALRICGVDMRGVKGWGRIMELEGGEV